MRLFAAILLSDEMKSSLIRMMQECRMKEIGGNYTSEENLHLTLCFIGETEDADKIIQALKKVKYDSFSLALSESGNFGNLIWAGADGGAALHELVQNIRKALKNAEIRFDEKEFISHITLLRKASEQPDTIFVPKSEMMVEKFSLMKSERVNGKMVYTEIASF